MATRHTLKTHDLEADGDEPSPRSPAVDPLEALGSLKGSLSEFWAHLTDYTQASKNLAKVETNRSLKGLWSGLFSFFIVVAGIIVSVVFVLRGLALGLTDLTGEPWLGHILSGGVFLAGIIAFIKLSGRRHAKQS